MKQSVDAALEDVSVTESIFDAKLLTLKTLFRKFY